MTSGRTRLSLLALLLSASLNASPASAWTLEQLLRGFARQTQAHASFVEKKTVRVLERPLVSSGELHFEAPDRLEKRTLRPRPELLRLDGDTLTLERGERRLQLSLRSQPELAAFVESIRATLAGDRQALERFYAVRLEGSERSWALTLMPREAGMASLVARIRIAGQDAQVTVIEIVQTNGDSTLMSVQRLPAP